MSNYYKKILIHLIFLAITFSQEGLKAGLNLRWQIPIDEAKELLRDAPFQFNSTTNDIKTTSINYTGGEFLNKSVDNWAFGFYQNKLYTYTINLSQIENAKSIYEELIGYFTKQYGVPLNDLEHIRDRRTFRTYYWYIKRDGHEDDLVELSTWLYKGVHISIHLYYGDILTIVNRELKAIGM